MMMRLPHEFTCTNSITVSILVMRERDLKLTIIRLQNWEWNKEESLLSLDDRD